MVLGPWKLPPEAFSRTLFVSFHFVSFLYCFGYFSFLCLENCPWKLSKGVFSRTPFLCFRFCIVLAICFLPFPWKLTLEIIQKRFFSNLSVSVCVCPVCLSVVATPQKDKQVFPRSSSTMFSSQLPGCHVFSIDPGALPSTGILLSIVIQYFIASY